MKFAVFAALMAIAMPAPALAADWVLVTENTVGDKFYIERQSIRTTSNYYKRVWMQVIFNQINKLGITKSKTYHEWDCSQDRNRIISSVFYKDDDVSFGESTSVGWKYVSPDSVEEILLNFVCKK